MNDSISRKKLLYELDKVMRIYNWIDDMAIMETLTYVRGMITEQPTVNEWVSAKEKLPKESDADKYGYVLVTRFWDMVMRLKFTEVNPNNARAWMPMPEPCQFADVDKMANMEGEQ